MRRGTRKAGRLRGAGEFESLRTPRSITPGVSLLKKIPIRIRRVLAVQLRGFGRHRLIEDNRAATWYLPSMYKRCCRPSITRPPRSTPRRESGGPGAQPPGSAPTQQQICHKVRRRQRLDRKCRRVNQSSSGDWSEIPLRLLGLVNMVASSRL